MTTGPGNDPRDPQGAAEDGENWREEERARPEHPLSVMLFSWMRTETFLRLFIVGVGVVSLGAVVAEWVLSLQSGEPSKRLIGFYGIFGGLAFALAVLAGWPLGAALRRPETHYDPPQHDKADAAAKGGADE
ncbi:hypothetical protein GC169_03470 [bacterium]|nr:hypothetical protein [bacterium]